MNVLLMGYYGYKNVGDDLFVKQLTQYFSKQESVKKISVLCNEDYYEKASDKVSFFASNNISKFKRLVLLLDSQCIAWGGGTLSLKGEPKNLSLMQQLSKLLGKRFCFLGVGLEIVGKGSEGTTKIFKNADLLYVRDQYSYQLALETLQAQKTCCLGGDLAFLDLSVYEAFLHQTKPTASLNNISFSGKFWWGEGRAEFYAQQLLPLIEKFNSVIHLLPAHLGDERNDNRFHALLQKYLPQENCQLHDWKRPEDFMATLSQMDLHLGTRLHSLILADILGVPNIGIGGPSSKIQHYIDKTQMLTPERIRAFMEPISVEQISKVVEHYQRPEAFILDESKRCNECIGRIFQKA
ncbi:polysaccharide pyruvyl transferase family protein [Leptolyngbya sp. FACHB-261]|uniref:polysaccharide pyruvyl transferase family protein n=1 Tax=Leptolyngbya sp. FACHB-261 TaxID=2692806 RepID=UPI001686C857|nr:polysaccharide pyruvyl transferase family protein [Leptolyngbya sp. FACHB-261]MBD2099528.1 polysaccharide pyruvyl transferase family protein [Leptolyngbya sp. FACHB-261]